MYTRLPVYLLLDVSESMVGEPIKAVENGLTSLINDLFSDPMALESVCLSVITFASKATQLVPLTDITKFKKPTLVMGSGTSLGSALSLLKTTMEKEIKKTTPTQKGDYKPMCFIMTDGESTDEWQSIANEFKKNISGKSANVIGVACGPYANTNQLQQITDSVVAMKNNDTAALKQFFKWVSASISTVSQRMESSGAAGVTLPWAKTNEIEFLPVGEQRSTVSDNFLYLHARCNKTKKFYIMRYEKQGKQYKAEGAYPAQNFDFGSIENSSSSAVDVDLLIDNPSCPYCNNNSWAHDGDCGHILCCSGEGRYTCPWCESVNDYYFSSFSVTKGRG